MKLSELILLEKIYIEASEQQKIHNCFIKWIDFLRQQYEDLLDSPSEIEDHVNTHFEAHAKKLTRSLLPTIRNIIKQHVPNNTTLTKYYSLPHNSKYTMDDYLGHQLSLKVYGYDTTTKGYTDAVWSKQSIGSGDNTHKLSNTIVINITPSQITNAITRPNHTNMGEWISTVTHEVTHLIQGLKSVTQTINNKKTYPGTNRENYLSTPSEIEAFAQDIASQILHQAQTQVNPVEKIDNILHMLKHGIRVMFDKEIFKGAQYDEYKELFTAPTTDKKTKANRQRVWRTFQTALVSKLLRYRDSLSGKIS